MKLKSIELQSIVNELNLNEQEVENIVHNIDKSFNEKKEISLIISDILSSGYGIYEAVFAGAYLYSFKNSKEIKNLKNEILKNTSRFNMRLLAVGASLFMIREKARKYDDDDLRDFYKVMSTLIGKEALV